MFKRCFDDAKYKQVSSRVCMLSVIKNVLQVQIYRNKVCYLIGPVTCELLQCFSAENHVKMTLYCICCS